MSFQNSFESVPLLTLGDDLEMPPTRVKDAAALRQIYVTFRQEDNTNAKNRGLMQMRLDGEPPWVQKELDDNGLGNMVNINFGGAEEQLELAVAPFYERLHGVDNLISVKTGFGEESDRLEWEFIMADEISRTVRAWPQFQFQTLGIVKHFIWDGLGLAHFENMMDWRFRASKLGEFYFPRQTFLSEDELEVTTAFLPRTATQLYRNIANEEIAEAIGWNVRAVKKAIKKAASGNPRGDDWEYLADQLKNNDISASTTIAQVRCIVGYWQEFDGSISCAICTETPYDEDGFLYYKRQQVSSMQEVLVMFPYGAGTNSKTHGIRGMGYKIYHKDLRRDMMLSRFMECAERQSSLIVQAKDEESMTELALVSMGNYSMLNPNVTFQEMPGVNLDQSVVPALREMDQRIAQRFGSYAPANSFGGERKTKFEVEAFVGQTTKLSASSMDYFDGPWKRLMKQVVKRMSRKNYMPAEPGGREIAELRLRLRKKKVPLEAFFMLDHEKTEIVKAIGSGSKAEKIQVLEHLRSIAPAMDDVGKHNLLRAECVAITSDPDLADQFVPRQDKKRTPPDAKIAMLENEILIQGKPVEVVDGESNITHAEVHMARLEEIWQAYTQGQMPIEQYATVARELHDHAAEHIEKTEGDAATEDLAGQIRQRLQQLGEDIANGIKAIQAAQRKQQEAQANGEAQQEGQPQGQEAPDEAKVAKFEQHRAQMKFAQEKHELKIQQTIETAQTKKNIADAMAAAKISHQGL